MRRLPLGLALAVLGVSAGGGELHDGNSDLERDPALAPAYFWMWNDALDTARLLHQLEDMRAHGLRNVCVHPFPQAFRKGIFSSAMLPDYLSEDYQKTLAMVFRRAGELGMHAYFYDEGGWPSGGACGLVAASDKDGRFLPRGFGFGGDDKESVGIRVGRSSRIPPYPSVVEPGTTERYLELVHDASARHLSDSFGSTVRIAFTDEPEGGKGVRGRTLGWTADFAGYFQRKKGYDLRPHVGEMLRRENDSDDRLARLRIDYLDTMADLFVERYLDPVRKRCNRHGLLSGGHLNGENVPEETVRYGHGSLLRSYRAMDVPGIDAIWRQIFPSVGGGPAVAPPYPRYASSVLHQQGGRYALSETFAIYGDALTPDQMKWVLDYQMARGINTFILSYYSLSNARQWMLLFEPHAGPITPYWDMQPHFFRSVENSCRMLSRGKPAAETAVLYDVRGIWAGGTDRERTVTNHYAAARALDRRGCDYDFVDDDRLAEAVVASDGLRVGAMTYRHIVLPTEKWLSGGARKTVEAFRRAGGLVVGCDGIGRVPCTLPGAENVLTVMKRRDGARSVYFVMNESLESKPCALTFPEGGRVVRYDPSADVCEGAGEAGCVERTFRGGESAIYLAGEVPTPVPAETFEGTPVTLGEDWTLRPLVSHEAGKDDLFVRACTNAAVPVALGDWRPTLGKAFSGKAVYRTAFEVPHGGSMRLDLGEVKWCASVRLNGKEVGSRFFGPFAWTVDVRKGVNELEVTVANLLSTHLGDAEVRSRIRRDWPPDADYERLQGAYDRENRESGLFGPVTLRKKRL